MFDPADSEDKEAYDPDLSAAPREADFPEKPAPHPVSQIGASGAGHPHPPKFLREAPVVSPRRARTMNDFI